MKICHPTAIVCVPAYNEERFIEATLESIKNQTHTDFLCVIRDNCSTDSTFKIASKFQALDHRFLALQGKSNLGAAVNTNELIRLTSSKYIMIIGAHDLIEPKFLELTIEELESRPNVSLCFSQIVKIDAYGNSRGISECSDLLTGGADELERYVNASTRTYENYGIINCLIRRSALIGQKMLRFDGSDHYLISALHYSGEFALIKKPLYKRRYLDRHPREYGMRLRGKPSKKINFLPLTLYTIYRFVFLPGQLRRKIALMPNLVNGLIKTYGPGIRIIYIPLKVARALRIIPKALKQISAK